MMGDGFYTTTWNDLVLPLNELVCTVSGKQATAISVHIGDRRLVLRIEGDELLIHANPRPTAAGCQLVVKPRVANSVSITTAEE